MPPKISSQALSRVLRATKEPSILPRAAREFCSQVVARAEEKIKLQELFRRGEYVFLAQKLSLKLDADGKDDPEYVRLLTEAAVAVGQGEPVAMAKDFFEKLTHFLPNSLDAALNAASFHLRIGEYELAKDFYISASRIDPEDSNIYFSLAETYIRLNREDVALLTFRQALSLDPDNTDGMFNMAYLLDDMGLNDEAKVAYRSVLNLNSHHETALINLVNLLVEEDDDDAFNEVQGLFMAYQKSNVCKVAFWRMAIKRGIMSSGFGME